MSDPGPVCRQTVLTTPQLTRDLQELDHLIAMLRRVPETEEIGDDLHWLQGRRRYVLTVLSSRRAQKGKRIVSLDLWRDGGVNLVRTARQAA